MALPRNPQKAWALWLRLQDLAEQLWQTHEDHFVEFCHDDLEPPSDYLQDHELPWDIDDDIPF